jgi:hypothetical protein
MLVVVMFLSAILVLRRLDLTRGKLEAEEVGPIAPTILEEENEDEAVAGSAPDDLRQKEDSD